MSGANTGPSVRQAREGHACLHENEAVSPSEVSSHSEEQAYVPPTSVKKGVESRGSSAMGNEPELHERRGAAFAKHIGQAVS